MTMADPPQEAVDEPHSMMIFTPELHDFGKAETFAGSNEQQLGDLEASGTPTAPVHAAEIHTGGTKATSSTFSLLLKNQIHETTELVNGTTTKDESNASTHDTSFSHQTTDADYKHSHVNGSAAHLEPSHSAHEDESDQMVEAFGQASSDHVIRLSGIEHCMPRSYIRVCLAYRLPNKEMLPEVEKRLNDFVRKTVDAKPYLSGYVVAVDNPGNRVGAVEIRFTDSHFLNYPTVLVRHFAPEEIDYLTYEELCDRYLPPSLIKPGIVSVLKESADEDWAPVFRIQANVIDGGIIISVYLHHCISDGTGAALLISGSLLDDKCRFDRYLDGGEHETPTMSRRLEAFAGRQSHIRNELSMCAFNQINNRRLQWKHVCPPNDVERSPKPIGRGCVFAFPLTKLSDLQGRLAEHLGPKLFITRNTVLMALIWHAMTRARLPSLSDKNNIMNSRLNIPIDIRNKLEKPLPEPYFGAAVDFASAELALCHLSKTSIAAMAQTTIAIRKAIDNVDDAYIRQAIALAMNSNRTIDVRDLQSSNMERAEGADMYITSWEKLKLYDATFEMGLGRPDWVRKPWSRDPGSCIVLPFDERKDYLEVVIQMAVADMERLLADQEFGGYVSRWIE